MSASEFFSLWLASHMRSLRRWILEQKERHFLMCADIEHQRAKEANQNASWYQKRAAMTRSQLNSIK